MDHIEENPRSVKKELLDEAFGWAKMIVFAVAFALAFNHFVIVNATVPTGSMIDTIMVHDRLVAFRLSYLFKNPERFDIVVFRFPDNESQLFVKRVIGLPGETVEIKNGLVYIDGSDIPLRDDFVYQKPFGDFGPYEVPDGHFFMMGDNRALSQDSRDWVNKYVAKDKILGKVIFKYYKGFQILTGA